MAIVRLKTRDQQVSELLFGMFKLPCAGYSSEVKPGPESAVVGGSAANINSVEATRLHAVNQLRKWIIPS